MAKNMETSIEGSKSEYIILQSYTGTMAMQG